MPSRAPTPPSPGNDNVAVWSTYEDQQQEYERCRDACHMWELVCARAFLPYHFFLLLMGLSPEALQATKMVALGAGSGSVAMVPLVPGQILVVPQSERIPMESAFLEAVDKAL
ncbi:hypothetical protein C0992_011398 [Termitomyces sp. T32_za158]|nr:hypothetical protein C0992_011398 [Termitomyces sp. T32_za158]